VQAVNEIIAGKKAITPETAVALADAFGTSPTYWLELESRYRLDVLRSKRSPEQESAIQRRAKLFSKAPVSELIKRGWIKADLNDLNQTERALCHFLNVSSLDEEPLRFAARKSSRGEPHTPAQIAWACQVRNIAKRRRSPKYSPQRLVHLLDEMPSWSTTEADTKKVPAALASAGVRLVFLEHLTSTRIDGGALWLDEVPVIALTLRYDRVDWFWFTLLHELAHIIEHEDSLDLQLVGNDAQHSIDAEEERADTQASEWLIPQSEIQQFVEETKPYYSRDAVLEFAGHLHRHPGIVVGQLQKRGEIPYSHHRNLLTRVRHLFTEDYE
jgi:HTH-type transcriptional regulator/antitoxin HigA